MDRIFSTSDVHPRDRFAYWHEVACKQIVGHNSEPLVRLNFDANLSATHLAGLPLLVFENAPMDVSRSRGDISKSACDDLFVCRQLAGTLSLEQQDQELSLEPGDFCLIDPMVPYHGRFRGSSKLLVVKISRQDLQARAGEVTALTARALQHAPLGPLTAGYLALLPSCKNYSGHSAAFLKEQLCDLVGACLSDIGGSAGGLSTSRTMALVRIKSTIREHLADPKLSAAVVAEAAGVSVRYANMLLAAEGTSLSRLIIKMRLERCRVAFDDPGLIHRSISEIAMDWGFSYLSHFSRVFKARYGLSPRDYRASKCPSSNCIADS